MARTRKQLLLSPRVPDTLLEQGNKSLGQRFDFTLYFKKKKKEENTKREHHNPKKHSNFKQLYQWCCFCSQLGEDLWLQNCLRFSNLQV